MCSYSYVLLHLHTKIVFIPTKSNILPHATTFHIIGDNLAFDLIAQR
jgi:hypothetical protein